MEARQRSALVRDMVPSILGYAVALAVVLSLVGDEVDSAGEWALMLMPVVPALWGVRAAVRHLRRVDEYQRLLQLEAMAAGFGVAMVGALTLGFVGAGGGTTTAGGWAVFGAGMVTWGLVALAPSRRG